MSNYPGAIDDDSSVPAVNNNLTALGAEAIDALRDAVFQIETALGINIAGSTGSLASRIGVFINPDGTPNSSTLTSLGLITLPITNSQIINNAGIPESKLTLDYSTQNLFNYIRDLSASVNTAIGWINVSGVKLEPHLIGAIYRHDLAQIDVAEVNSQFLNNVFRVLRNNTSAYSLAVDMNNELLAHQWADGSILAGTQNILTNDGGLYPSNYGHTASGIFLNSSRFAIIPQTTQDVQAFADFFDTSSIISLGTRIQNLYANGVSRNSRSSSLTNDGYGQSIIPTTPAIAYLRGMDNISSPVDSISIGDDIIQFQPSASAMSTNVFDEQFALVRVGDIITVSYAGDGYNVALPFVISEKKYVQSGIYKTYIVRIAGKNIAYAPNATASISRPLFNNNKYGVLATAGVNSPSLIIGTPRGAQCLGVGFSPDQFNETHYLLNLVLYPDGNPIDGQSPMLPIDMTGNQGTTPGSYSLDGIVSATNSAFQQAGYNYRFIAFAYEGEFGLMLADSYNNSSFSVISAVVNSSGQYDQTATQTEYPNNVIDLFPITGSVAPDPLGYGPFGANLASPPFQATYPSTSTALYPTVVFPPLRRNNYYVNGAEREIMTLDVAQSVDQYGDGYWPATIDGYSDNPGPPGSTSVSYLIPLDLSASQLKIGKTLVVQPATTNYGLVNYGRFIISNITFNTCGTATTEITVQDGIHDTGVSPSPIAIVGSRVCIYFDSSSVGFNAETATDFAPISSAFKRFFEVYVDDNGNTFTHERGRFSIAGTVSINGVNLYNSNSALNRMDLLNISPTLRGYLFGSVNKICLQFNSISTNGEYDGYLCSFDGTNLTQIGQDTFGKIGSPTTFFDDTNNDFITISFPINSSISLANQFVEIQLFPTLALDEELMLLSYCQVNTSNNQVSHISDRRQFGNVSEEELTTSALNYIALPDKLLRFNGVVRGFDALSTISTQYGTSALFSFTGGLALVNGNLEAVNDQIFTIPAIQEVFASTNYPINYAICVNTDGDLITIVLTDYENDGFVITPNAPNRVVSVINLVSTTIYQVESDTFSNILNSNKDLTPLYIATSRVSGSGSSAITSVFLRDIRRFVNDADASIQAVLTSENSQGNFKSIGGALTWLSFNSAFQNTLQVKGSFVQTGDPGFSFPLNIVAGGSLASMHFTTDLNMSQASFNGITLIFDGAIDATNVSFTSCNVSFNSGSAVNILTGVSFVNCTVSFVEGLGSDISDFTAIGTTFNVATQQCFTIQSSGITFTDCIFNYTANPVGGTPTYNTNDLVNAGSGMIYYTDIDFSANFVMNGISITGCTFNNTVADRFSFVSLQLTGYGSIVQDVNISGNQFVAQTSATDIRAVIAITTTLMTPASAGSFPQFPKLVNVNIDGNICNYDQMILISAYRVPGGTIIGPFLECVNVNVLCNTCGTIGFITSGGGVSFSNNATLNSSGIPGIRDKKSHLLIQSNVCKLITNLDFTGVCIPFKDFGDVVQACTGTVSILSNSASWISVGSASNPNDVDPNFTVASDGIIISGNRLSPYRSPYLTNYTDNNITGAFIPNVGIYYNLEFSNISSTQGIISNNSIVQNPLIETNGTATILFYDIALACYTNANIYGNTITGVVNDSAKPMVFLFSSSNGPTINFTNNILTRDIYSIKAYVASSSASATSPNSCTIINNIFDSQFVDAGNTIENPGQNIPANWIFERNKNQVAYASVPVGDLANISCYGSISTGTIGDAMGFIRQQVFGVGSTSVAMFGVTSTTETLNIALLGDISRYLPTGIIPLYSVMGVSFDNTSVDITKTNNIQYELWADKSPQFTIGSFAGSLADNVANGNNTRSILYASNPLNITTEESFLLTTVTQYISADLTTSGLFTTSPNMKLNVRVFGTLNSSVASPTLHILLSPLLIKYKW